jgi:Flp pilus assembly pilin Flp
MLKDFLRDETGAELAEYSIAVAMLVAIAVVVYQALGDAINDKLSSTATTIRGASY